MCSMQNIVALQGQTLPLYFKIKLKATMIMMNSILLFYKNYDENSKAVIRIKGLLNFKTV